eukprot:365443-Chlamydomonas_euryale.AAC.20
MRAPSTQITPRKESWARCSSGRPASDRDRTAPRRPLACADTKSTTVRGDAAAYAAATALLLSGLMPAGTAVAEAAVYAAAAAAAVAVAERSAIRL